jgi:hypothetical protein
VNGWSTFIRAFAYKIPFGNSSSVPLPFVLSAFHPSFVYRPLFLNGLTLFSPLVVRFFLPLTDYTLVGAAP